MYLISLQFLNVLEIIEYFLMYLILLQLLNVLEIIH
jgi:hypothetical protein